MKTEHSPWQAKVAEDRDQDGRLTREEFLANQADPEEAKVRFTKWDLDQDASLSREEFIAMGAGAK